MIMLSATVLLIQKRLAAIQECSFEISRQMACRCCCAPGIQIAPSGFEKIVANLSSIAR
jgi:predicted methyltransferase